MTQGRNTDKSQQLRVFQKRHLEAFSCPLELKAREKIDVVKTGLEMDCKYENFSNGKQTREQYLKALDKCVEISKKPALVHVNGFNDLPTEEEMKKFDYRHDYEWDKLVSAGNMYDFYTEEENRGRPKKVEVKDENAES